MITKQNYEEVLSILGFEEVDGVFEKTYSDVEATMRVSFSEERLIYPDSLGGGKDRNNDFLHPENFVVFECVNRLLEKGYRPDDIKLEKEWHLGHTPAGGRADICVSGANDETLFIVECKTYGKEFSKELVNMKQDGGQLFSYWQQETSCKWLVLYSSDIKNEKVEYQCHTINCSDDPNLIHRKEKGDPIKLYKEAHTAEQKYDVWKDTYNFRTCGDLVFSSDSVAYNIGEKPLLKKDLRSFSSDDKIVNKFEEILRHNNVSDKENAFNRLVALFICKLVDEVTKGDNDEVEFQYKEGTDSYETLQDRLQRLHSKGMKDFMGEEIYYIDDNYPEKLFKNYTGQKRKEAVEDLKNTIRILKFYTNNDFAFKDVHNEELFFQNGEIVVEVVRLFENYRIVYPSKHQLLGDLFEQLLNKGFKQNEGQFFTPMPITRFIWDSLPVKKIIESDDGQKYPKVVDYACGAGHFLIEAVEAINFYSSDNTDNSWVRDSIYGIEKDYRLARVSKISLFMNGAGEGNIIFGDGLENTLEKGIKNEIFDILVSNPPYSVKDFKQHLNLKNNCFSLLDKISSNGKDIETLFVERTAQLLKPKGVAAVILPSTILTNDTPAGYVGAREMILENFYIRSIVSLESATFSATGTKTVILFLEKFDEPPKRVRLCADTVEAIFKGENLSDWEDGDILDAYTAHIQVSLEDYIAFLGKNLSFDELKNIDYFKMYYDSFSHSKELADLRQKNSYIQKTESERTDCELSQFYESIFRTEKKKIFYFSLIYMQETVTISVPSDVESQKRFLGYSWSNRKGMEGIQIDKNNPGGEMYDDLNRAAEGTLASAIRNSFDGIIPSFTDDQLKYASLVRTKDLVDFSRPVFNTTIRTSRQRQFEIHSKFNLKPLDAYSYVSTQKGTMITQQDTTPGEYKVVAGGKDYAYTHNKYNRDENTITVSASGAYSGHVNFWREKIFASDCTTIQTDSLEHTLWIYYFLKSIQGQIYDVLQKGASLPHVYMSDIKKIPIPDIDDAIMSKLVAECDGVFQKYEQTSITIKDCRKEINRLYKELDDHSENNHKFYLSDSSKFDVSIGRRVVKKDLVSDGHIPVYSANVNAPFGYTEKLLIEDFSLPSILWGIDGDWMTNYIPENNKFYPTDHCGVLRCFTQEVNPKYMCHILQREGSVIGYSRTLRANTENIRQDISFSVADRPTQDEYINKIFDIERTITEKENALSSFEKEISDIIIRYIA